LGRVSSAEVGRGAPDQCRCGVLGV
jgi:hypothetical protein